MNQDNESKADIAPGWKWLPCPWCGTSQYLKVVNGLWNGKGYGYAVCCKEGCCCGPVKMAKAEAVKAWQQQQKI